MGSGSVPVMNWERVWGDRPAGAAEAARGRGVGHFGSSEGLERLARRTRVWAARVSLWGERGCASEPVAREGGMCAGPEGVRRPETGPERGRSREIGPRFLRNAPSRRGSFINFSEV